MAFPDVADRTAVRDDITIKAPLLTQDVCHQCLICAAWFTVRAVVSAHDRLRLAFDDGGAKGGQVRFAQISFSGSGIEAVPFGFWSTVHGIVFRGGYQFQISRIVALQAFDESNPQSRSQIW